jgi:hypothetical protein
MGEFQRFEPCPNCGSRDNLGVYSDGKWCFGCGYRVPGYKGMSVDDIRKQIRYEEDRDKKKSRKPYLPEDFSLSIPPVPLEWLRKYGVTDEEIQRLRIGWSESHGALVFPAYDVFGNLLLVQLRQMAPKGFYTRGFPESVIWTVAPTSPVLANSLCVVEDFVSCIRVGRIVESMPLWGSNLSLNQIRRLCDRYERLYLWLDFDKAGHAAKLRIKALPYFRSVSVIVTELDPKDYTDEQIGKNLGVVP